MSSKDVEDADHTSGADGTTRSFEAGTPEPTRTFESPDPTRVLPTDETGDGTTSFTSEPFVPEPFAPGPGDPTAAGTRSPATTSLPGPETPATFGTESSRASTIEENDAPVTGPLDPPRTEPAPEAPVFDTSTPTPDTLTTGTPAPGFRPENESASPEPGFVGYITAKRGPENPSGPVPPPVSGGSTGWGGPSPANAPSVPLDPPGVRSRTVIIGLVLLMIGLSSLASQLGDLDVNPAGVVLTIMVAAGVVLMAAAFRRRRT